MAELIHFWEQPKTPPAVMIAGWYQWADAGNISSGLPEYLIKHGDARRIGEINPDGFYLFQIPGTHHFLRPEVTLKDGQIAAMEHRSNNIYFSDQVNNGMAIFLGEEPHLDADRYAQAFLDAAEALGVKRIAAVAGVYGSMPYDRERDVSCVFSLPAMQEQLADYSVRFSEYQGGATIGTFIVDLAKQRGIEMVIFYAYVPAYDFSDQDEMVQGVRIDNDFKAWYELLRRINRLYDLRMDLSQLEQYADDLVASMADKIADLDRMMPELKVRDFMKKVDEEFTEKPYMPLDDIWEEELGDLLAGFDNGDNKED